MVDAEAHRGPDGEGLATFEVRGGFLVLGHRRLSILDLSETGAQPMIHPESRAGLTYNGELYNFAALREELRGRGARFRGHSDTEVLLAALEAWGEAALPRFRGMYAFAWYQPREQKLLLARDPLGIKPLQYARTRRGGVFASELSALLASGWVEPAVDRRGIA